MSKWRGRHCHACGTPLKRHCPPNVPGCHWYDCTNQACEWVGFDVRNARGIRRDAV